VRAPLLRRRFAGALVCLLLIAGPAAIVAGAAPGRQGPPPTPVPPDGRLSPFPQELHTPRDPVPAPHVDAAGAILADLSNGAILFEQQPDAPRPIASLTKVMTALLTLERTELDDVVIVDPAAVYEEGDYGFSSTVGLRAGERRTVRQLLEALLLGSANDAAEALAIHVGGSVDGFVRDMNRRAGELRMRRTEFRSPHGLDDRGRSTPQDLVRLVRAANATPGFTSITRERFAEIPSPSGKPRRIQNRNAMLWLYPGAFGTKTGFTALAGPTLIASATREGRELVAIVLHAARGEAFSDAAALLDHGFAAFEERELVAAGDPFGAVELRGGAVTGAAGSGLEGLVPGDADVATSIAVDPGAAFPPAPGERIGTVTVLVDGRRAGEVPLVAGEVPPPAPLDGPWWARGAVALWDAVTGTVEALAEP
jgi:serine-type D-Ala-D-Ala carboxypeptidase (penicillin-binding protein 5/6)